MIASHPALACLKGVPLVLTLASAMCLRKLICFIKHFILPTIMEHSPVEGDVEWRCFQALIELASEMGHLTLTDLACGGFSLGESNSQTNCTWILAL